QELKAAFPGYYIIPEGGAGPLGEKGAGEILNLVNKTTFTHIACAIGTATMFNGILKSTGNKQQLIGIPVLKGLEKIAEQKNTRIFNDYHFGGYAKYTNNLLVFMNDFYKKTYIPADFVYTGKLIFAIYDLLQKDYFPENSKILIIHSGGLQGNQSLPKGTLIF
ncbi:MAG TPA: hypothetical protein VI548_05130, partial [Chitinophagaceae bacterium]|nr:hypothetical protein [Chitinophagaceae bacterium]